MAKIADCTVTYPNLFSRSGDAECRVRIYRRPYGCTVLAEREWSCQYPAPSMPQLVSYLAKVYGLLPDETRWFWVWSQEGLFYTISEYSFQWFGAIASYPQSRIRHDVELLAAVGEQIEGLVREVTIRARP